MEPQDEEETHKAQPTTTTISSQTLVSETQTNKQSQSSKEDQEEEDDNGGESKPAKFGQKEIVGALQVVERDSLAIAQSFTTLFASLRLALSEVTSSSVDHMQCFSDAAGRLQECALDATTKGNRYINSCLRLNEEMKGVDSLAMQLKVLRRNVDTLDSAVNRLLRPP